MHRYVVPAVAFAAALALGLSATGVVTATVPQDPKPLPDGRADTGKALYLKDGCWQCHGREAQGGGYVGPRLAPDPLPFGAFSRYVRNPLGDMPPFSTKVVSDDDMRDIYAFLKSVAAPPAVQTLTPLSIATVTASQPAPPAVASCEHLATLSLAAATVTSAGVVAAGAFTPPVLQGGNPPTAAALAQYARLPAFCRVAATLRPSSDSDIKIEVWLPLSGWNGKFAGVGNGGWAGTVNYAAIGAQLSRGYAASSTDTGHAGGGGEFALGHPEKITDFAYRAMHDMTVKAKAIVAAYYGAEARLSYWSGCSTGGRQGLKEAQRFPEDYDAIVSGAPANNWTRLQTQQLWVMRATLKTAITSVPQAKLEVLSRAVLDACDKLDGVRDGVLEDPMACHFDPKSLQCANGDVPTCLTAPQVEAVRKVYGPAKNPRTGDTIYPGFAPGSEPLWGALVSGPKPFAIPIEYYKYLVFENPDWDYQAFDFDKDVSRAEQIDGGAINTVDPNLRPFFGRGGKLLMYHGWNDQLIAPQNSIDYFTRVATVVGGTSKASESIRLFMVPGMAHCNGGPGTSSFDMVSALEQWVEGKQPPERILASRMAGGTVDRTRPLCPYPQVATYLGSGNTDEAANFVCKAR